MTTPEENFIEKKLEEAHNKYVAWLTHQKYSYSKSDWEFLKEEIGSAMHDLLDEVGKRAGALKKDIEYPEEWDNHPNARDNARHYNLALEDLDTIINNLRNKN